LTPLMPVKPLLAGAHPHFGSGMVGRPGSYNRHGHRRKPSRRSISVRRKREMFTLTKHRSFTFEDFDGVDGSHRSARSVLSAWIAVILVISTSAATLILDRLVTLGP
jgi:hypothetical protein